MTAGRVLVWLCCSSLAACGVPASAHPSPPRSASGAPEAALAATSVLPSPVLAAPALTSGNTNPTAGGVASFTCNLPINRAASGNGPAPGGLARPTTARVAGQTGFDRIDFEYSGAALPSLSITSVTPPFTTDPAGAPLAVTGKVFLGMVFHNVPGIVSGYSGPTRFKPGLPVLTDLESNGDFEGVQSWVVGLSGQACIRVFTLTGPTRLVIDLESSSPGLPKSGQRMSGQRKSADRP